MKRLVIAGLLMSLSVTAAYGGSRREASYGFPLQGAAEILVEMEVGELTIETVDIDAVEVRLDIRCRNRSATCERRIELIEAVEDRRGDRLHVRVEGVSKTSSHRMEVEAHVRVPRAAGLIVDMGVGELDITGSERDVFVDMGIGEVRMWLDQEAVGSVFLDAGIGESALYGAADGAYSSRPFLIGSELDWDEGEGRAEVVVDLGIGEITVHLE